MPQRLLLPEVVFLRFNPGCRDEDRCVIPTQRLAGLVEGQSRSLTLATGMAVDGLGRVHSPIMNSSSLIVETQINNHRVTSYPPISAHMGDLFPYGCAMAHGSRRTVWSTVYAISTWTLITYFSLMAIVHLVLTVLFYLGIWDTGVGYVLDYDVPAWLITILDGSAAYLLWMGYRRGIDNAWLGLSLTLVASVVMMARASWFVIIPVLIVLTISGSIHRIVVSHRADERHA
jgi:hypothetical protein